MSYSVAHGIDDYPREVGRDIDVLIRQNDVSKALDSAERILRIAAYHVIRPPDLFGRRLLAIDPDDWNAALEVHSIPRLAWRNVVFVEDPKPLEWHGPFAIDPWASFVKRILTPLLAGDSARFSDRSLNLVLSAEELKAARESLPLFCGKSVSLAILEAVAAHDAGALRRCAKTLRATLMIRGVLRAPLQSLAGVLRTVTRRIRQLFSPCAPVVVLTGGSEEKLAGIVQCLKEGPRSIFTKIVIRSDASQNGIRYFTRWLRDRLDSSRQRLVIYKTLSPQFAVASDLVISLETSRREACPPKTEFVEGCGSVEEMAEQIRKQILTAFVKEGRHSL